MKEKILICSIFRNRENFINRWYNQILSLIEDHKEIEFSISVYENDSKDNTKNILKNINLSMFHESSVQSEDIGTNYYGSIVDEQRVKNLALARNKCIYNNKININNYSKILFIEPDFLYSKEDASKILTAEKKYIKKFDIISGISIYNGNFYDTWATRIDQHQTHGSVTKQDALIPHWSTFNGFCLYNAQPFKENITFDWYNKRLKTYDCDTVVVCENFREKGYNNIFIECSAVFYHEF